MIIQPCDVTFEAIYRPAGGGADQVILSGTEHFEPRGMSNFDAVPYETAAAAAAIDARAGDQVVYRFTIVPGSTTAPTCFVPNGEGENSAGRIPFLEIPGR